MYKNLSMQALGQSVKFDETCALARRHDFAGVELDLQFLRALGSEQSAMDWFGAFGPHPGGYPLNAGWRESDSDESFVESSRALQRANQSNEPRFRSGNRQRSTGSCAGLKRDSDTILSSSLLELCVNPKIDAFIARSKGWPSEMATLRPVLLSCGLSEAIKWGKPCYSFGDDNIAIMQQMKAFLSLMFFKGALLEDPTGALRSQGAESRSATRLEFTSSSEITASTKVIRALVKSAIAVEAAGLSVGPAPAPVLVAELEERLARDVAFRTGFESLTPGRRREYNLHFADAKQAVTRTARVDKYADKITNGRGLRD